LGDSIQFCRYAKLVSDLGARVVLEVPNTLVPLLRTLQGVSLCLASGSSLPEFDYHCPLLSLPRLFQTQLATIPCAPSYLASDPQRRQHWTARLGEKRQRRIGLVWRGSASHKNDYYRSVALEQMLRYLPDQYEYISLQKDISVPDQQLLQGRGIQHHGAALRDFSDTAALCELMDIVISVDTSVAHLSAALGKPTWLLLPIVPDWRWLQEREDSPWYPSVRLFRQGRDASWGAVMARVASALLAH
jgi:hypothetical protein